MRKLKLFGKTLVVVSITSVASMVMAAEGDTSPAAHTAIEETIVIGSKIPKKTTELTHSVTVVNEFQIEVEGFTDVTEILRKQVGIEFKQAGGVGQFNYLKMRGLASDNVLVIIDGVKINKASSGNTGNLLSQLDPSTIESIEILRGPQATLYGANTPAGVIVINTKTGHTAATKIGVEAGSLDWFKVFASLRNTVEIGAGDLVYSLNASDTDSNNTHKFEFFEDTTLQARVSYELENLTFGLNAFSVDNAFGAAELDENYSELSSRAEHWAFQTPDPDNTSVTTEEVYSIFAEHHFNEALSHKLQISQAKNSYTRHDKDNGLLGRQIATVDGIVSGSVAGDVLYIYDRRYPSIELAPLDLSDPANDISNTNAYYKDQSDQYEYRLLYTTQGYNLITGIEYLEQEARQWGSYGVADNDDSQMSLYLNGDVRLLDSALILAFGVRQDDYESWGKEMTGNVGISCQLTELTAVYANTGTSFTPATMSQLFNPGYGDSSLSPETGITYELGIRQSALNNALSLEATYWNTQIDNVISFDYSIANPRRSSGFGQYNNGEKARASGAELQASYQPTDTIALDANYTYTDSQRKPVGDDWQRTVQVARNKGNLGLSYQEGSIAVAVNAYYAGPRLRWKGDVEMKEYVRVDLSAQYQWATTGLALSARIENLFDEDIEEGLGYEEPGLYAIFGVSYSF